MQEFSHSGNTYTEYLLNKRDSIILVAQNCPEFTAAIVDRWQELESGKTPPAVARQQDPTARAVLLAGLVSDALNLHGSARLNHAFLPGFLRYSGCTGFV